MSGGVTSLLRALCQRWTWSMAWRDTRSQKARLFLYALSIAVGIGALTAIHALKDSVQTGVDSQAKTLLGADVLISSRRPISQERLVPLARLIRESARETAFSSMLSRTDADHVRMVQVRALEGGFPFEGKVETTPPDAWKQLPTTSGILLDPVLMLEFNVQPGSRLKLGALELTVLGAVKKGVPRSSRFSGFAPEVFVREADLAATGLVGAQSLVYHHQTLELTAQSEPERKSAVAEIRKALSENGVQVQTPENRKETIGEGLNKAGEFLGITAIAALVLGGIGVAGAIHTHIRRRLPSVAILLCLGCSKELAFAVYLAQASALGLLGALIGTGTGAMAHAAVVHFAAETLPLTVAPFPHLPVLLRAATAGFLMCCGFTLLPLLRIREISPSATLSGRTSGKSRRTPAEFCVYALLLGAVWGVARANGAGSLRSLAMTGGLCAVFLILAGVAWSLMQGARRILQPSWPYLLRQGVSNLFRPHNQTLLFILSLGMGVFLLLSTWFTKSLVLEEIKMDGSASGPNLYIIDVQPDQTDAVAQILKQQKLPLLEDAPMVTMRIQSVKGLPLSAMEQPVQGRKDNAPSSKGVRVPRWVMEREYRSSFRSHLNPSETILAGAWPPPPFVEGEPIPISLEQQLAKDLKVALGDEIVMDVQGVPLRTRVSCLRKVDWSKFNINFFMIFPPGSLEGAPQFHVITTRTPGETASSDLQRALLQATPNVSAVDLTNVLATVSALLEKAGTVLELMAGFTLLAGLPILLGALLNGKEQRLKESVLLRTLGASEQQVKTIILVEYTVLGLLAGLAGCGLAWVAHWAIAHWIFKADMAHVACPSSRPSELLSEPLLPLERS